MLEEANEVQEVLGRSYGMPEIDEDELEEQLDALLDDMALVSQCFKTDFIT
jgi:charged multivesicular body protein 5